MEKKDIAWHSQEASEVAAKFDTHLQRGLTAEEAAHRLARYGPNQLREIPRPGFWRMLLDQFNNFLVLILIAASLASFLLGDYVEAIAILAIVILNAVLGVVQESKAEEALAALKRMTAPEARVIRDGQRQTIPSREVVPGDLVLLESGNYVPADVRLVESVNLQIDEASLTGESIPVRKRAEVVLDREIPLGDRSNSAYMGTLVTYGRGRGVVFATGMHTQIGLIAEMIQSYEEEPTPLQVKLNQLGRWLGVICLSVCGVVFLVGLSRGVQWLEMFLVAVSLAIAAVPEGLPAVVTICLALGMQRMIKRHALLRKLPAVETLGSATIICADKTGTMTQNQMVVVRLWADHSLLVVTGEGYHPEGEFRRDGQPVDLEEYPGAQLLLRGALLCNDACLETSGLDTQRTYRLVGDPTEGALVVAAAKAGLWKEEVEEVQPRLAEIPFEAERKRMTTIHPDPTTKGYVAYIKGAPAVVLQLCDRVYLRGREEPLNPERRDEIVGVNASLASQALRLLGVAYRRLKELPEEPQADQVEQDLVFVGLLGMIDPPRPEVREAIALARRAGIRTVMITGDYPDTAMAIAKDLELSHKEGGLLTGAELDRMDEVEFAGRVEEFDVYARVSPQHKVGIVEALKEKGHVVAMTGDGANDAPALKRADIGVAMGVTGTDVSKETADMVLTDDNYASIVSAVEEGRIIYSNIRKFVFYLLSCNVAEILVIFLAMMVGWPLPLTAIQLLVLNLITDGAPALALGLEKGEPDIMERPPRPVDEPVINREMGWGITIQGIAITTITLIAFRVGLDWFPNNLSAAQTMAFATLSISELLRAYTSRSERYSVWSIGPLSNRYMQWATLTSLVILLAIIYLPFLDPIFDTAFLGWREWAVMIPLLLLPSVAAEATKLLLRRQRPLAL
ncbi:MAG: cation-translocating P-type ATPase [Anaerolineae bacterium]